MPSTCPRLSIRRAQTELCSLPPKKHQVPNGEALALEAGASAPGANSARRLPDVQKFPPSASEPARVARSAVAASHPWPHHPSIKTLGHMGSGRGPFHLRLYSALHSDQLSKTADRRSVLRQPAPCVRHIDQDGSVRSVGGASRQSKAIDGVLPIVVASTQDCPLPYYPTGHFGATKVRRKHVGHLCGLRDAPRRKGVDCEALDPLHPQHVRPFHPKIHLGRASPAVPVENQVRPYW